MIEKYDCDRHLFPLVSLSECLSQFINVIIQVTFMSLAIQNLCRIFIYTASFNPTRMR